MQLSAPWYEFQRKLASLFAGDADIEVGDLIPKDMDDEGHYVININVKNHEKFVALDRCLISDRNFGGVNVQIILYDLENNQDYEGTELMKTLFKGNLNVAAIEDVVDRTETKHCFVCFKPEVVQFFNDNIDDFNGNWNGLQEDIATDILSCSWNVHFCTAAK